MKWAWIGFAVMVGVFAAAGGGLWMGLRDGDTLINPEAPVVETPDCDDVWQEGELLPDDYQGCRNEVGTFIAPIEIVCFNRSGNWLVALPDGTIREGGMCR